MTGNAVLCPQLSCLVVHFVIAAADSPGQEEGGKAGRRGERREREEGVESERRKER